MSQKIKTSVEIDGSLSASQIANATTDTDKFLVSDGGTVKYRTGAEVLSDLGVSQGTASRVQHQVKAGVAINKGQAVYVTSADGTNMIVGLASNASESTSSKTMGLLNATVAINGFADVITEGLLDGLNTSAATIGDPVWLGTGGNLIYGLANKPYAPNHLVFIGIVTRVNANNGEIFVKVQNGFELDEIHDVDLKTTTKVNGHLLGYNGSLWVNKTIAEWLGYTPYNASNPAGYISSYTETDTLSSVTGRGASTSNQITLSGGGDNSNTYSSLRFSGYNQGGGVGYHGFFEIENTYSSGTNKKKFFRLDSSGTIQIINSAYTANIFNLTDAGDLTVNKIIKSGGTSSQYLMADGSVSTGGGGGVTSFNTRTGAVTLSSGDVTSALGYTPYNSSNPNGYISSYTETDTLATVTARGASTSSNITITNTAPSFTFTSTGLNRSATLGITDGANMYISAASNGNLYLGSGTTTFINGSLSSDTELRSPIFYDSNNTTYYLDPASTSNLNALTLAGTFSAPGYNKTNWDTAFGWGNHAGLYLGINSKSADSELLDGIDSSRVIYGDNSTGTASISDATLNGALKSGFYTVGTGGIPNATSVNFVLHTAYNGVGNAAGFDLACNDSTTSSFYLRPATGGGKGAWQTIVTSSNVSSYAVPTSRTITINGTSYDLSANRSWTVTASETDTLATVTGRGSTTSTGVGFNNYVNILGQNSVYWYNSSNTSYARTYFDGGTFNLDKSLWVTANIYGDIFYDRNNTAYYLNPNGQSIFGGGDQYVLGLQHSAAQGDFVDALFLQNSESGGRVQIGMSSNGSDGQHHRVSLRAYKGSGNYEGTFGIALRQADTSNVQKLTLTSAGNLTVSPGGTSGAYYLSDTSAGLYRDNSYDVVLLQNNSSGNKLHLASAGEVRVSIDSNDNDSGSKFVVGNNAVKSTNELFSVDESGTVFASSNFRAPIFYDSADTSYYWNPNTSSGHRFQTPTGYLDLGSMNGSWCHFQTDRPNFYFGSGVHVNGGVTIYGTSSYLDSGRVQAPIFYDSNDTSYYVDPAGNGTRAAVFNGNLWITPKPESYGEGVTFNMPNQATWGGLRWYRNGSAGGYSGNWAFGYFGNESNNDVGFHNGTNGWRLDHSFNMTSLGSVRSPIFYDSSDTGYYWNPNADASHRFQTPSGYIDIGPKNGGTCHIYTDRPSFYFNKDILVNGSTVLNTSNAPRAANSYVMFYEGFTLNADSMSTNSTGFTYSNGAPYTGPIARFSTGGGYDLWLNASYGGNGTALAYRTRNGDAGTHNSWHRIYSDSYRPYADDSGTTGQRSFNYLYASSYLESGGAVYGTIFYDNNNRGYYMDPDGTSQLSSIYTNNWVRVQGDSGVYSQDYGGHLRRPVNASHGTWEIFGYNKNGYAGMNVYDPQGYNNNYMHESGNGGLYQQNGNGWVFYHSRGNACLGIMTSTTSSSYKLYVGGSIYAEGDVVAYSDRRKKENIVTVDNALETVNKLRGVYYNRIDDDSKKRQVGVIAQEIQEVLPEVVTYAKDLDEYGVSYGNITGLLIEAIKEQQTQIKELKELLNNLINK